MAQKISLTVGATKIKTPAGQFFQFDATTDILVGLTEYIIIPNGGSTTTNSKLVTAGGFEIDIDNSIANLATFISSTDAST